MSSVLDESTARSLDRGRQAIGRGLRHLQKHLQKAFIAFVVGMLGSILAMRWYVWDFLKATARSAIEKSDPAANQIEIIVQTPFDVILLQVKIGIFVGVLLAVPTLLWAARDTIRERLSDKVPVSRVQLALIVLLGVVLGTLGIIYAYSVFFPFMFAFLANNAVRAGVAPKYGIVEFTEFMLFLTLSFALAAELPLVMSALSYAELVSYEFFRDKWRHAVVLIFGFGAAFTPPDPFTQIMFATPLCTLYGFSLGVSKVVTNIRRSADSAGDVGALARKGYQFLGVSAALSVVGAALLWAGVVESAVATVRPALPAIVRPPSLSTAALSPWGQVADLAVGGIALGIAGGLAVAAGYFVRMVRRPLIPRDERERGGGPGDIDLGNLDADAVRAAPDEVFAEMDEDEALERAESAMDDDRPEKAQAILDRFDEVAEADDGDDDGEEGMLPTAEPGVDEDDGADEGNVVTETAAGIVDPFTEDETTEDDIGGYFYDLRFIFESLTSKMFRIVGVFLVVLFGTFFALYKGGIGLVLKWFLQNVPRDALARVAAQNPSSELTAAEIRNLTATELLAKSDFVIALHPVEVLIFSVKLSGIIAIATVVPLVLYYAWPALKERGLASGDRRVFFAWGLALLGGFVAGSLAGFLFAAPTVISFLVYDAIDAGMIVAYRIRKFLWLVFLLTGGIGVLADIPVTMALFHFGGIVSFERMYDRWRLVVFLIFAAAMFVTPQGIMLMLIVAIPTTLTFLLGLGLLYVATLPSRGGRPGATGS